MIDLNMKDWPAILSVISKVNNLKSANLFDSFMILTTSIPGKLYVESPAFRIFNAIQTPGVHMQALNTKVMAIAQYHRSSPSNYDRDFDEQIVEIVKGITNPTPGNSGLYYAGAVPQVLYKQGIQSLRYFRQYEDFTKAINSSPDKEFLVMRIANQALYDRFSMSSLSFVSATFSVGQAGSVKAINKRPGYNRAHFDECFYIVPKNKHNEKVIEHFTYLLLANALLEGKPATMSTKVAPWVSRYIATLAPDLLVN